MVRVVKKKKENDESTTTNPEAIERKRLKSLSFSNNILSQTPATTTVHLNPSTTVVKHHGKDIIKKSHRKSKFLFSFSSLLAPVAGGKIGELKDLGTKNPILYLHFPQGQMKLFGTIVYPQNRYLTLQFSRGGKNVMCEDYFDNMIVFSDAWWIGRKDENPEEARLEFPKELYEGQEGVYDFKGGAGAGAASVVNQGLPKTRVQRKELESPQTSVEDDLSDSEINPIDTKEEIAVRRSMRTPKKPYTFAENSSGGDSGESNPDLSEQEDKVKKHPCSVVVDIDNEDAAEEDKLSRENEECALKSKKVSQVASATASKEVLSSNRGPLLQATISTLFKKMEDLKAPRNSRKSQSSKVSGQQLQPAGSKRKIDLDEGPKKRARKIKDKDPGENIMAKNKEHEIEDDDDIEEFSNASEGTNDSDEDWTV